MNADVPQIVQCLVNAQARLFYGTKTILPKIAARNTRGPILFKFVRVDYDKTQGKLKLSKRDFPGHSVQSLLPESMQSLLLAHSKLEDDCYSTGKKIPREYPHMKEALMEINLGEAELYLAPKDTN